jgi:RNA polymerase sigma-70 factor (ECF subfamily)
MENKTSDEELMMSYAAGNADAFETLYQRYKAPLYGFVSKQSGEQVVDELFQDIWLKVINARNSYQVKATFKTWLYHLARNRIIDQYRKNTIKPVHNNETELDELENTAVAQPEKYLDTQNQYDVLLNAITDLPREQKEVFLLREEAGLSVEQIAETCGINFETAKSRLRYAVKKLREAIDEVAGAKDTDTKDIKAAGEVGI